LDALYDRGDISDGLQFRFALNGRKAEVGLRLCHNCRDLTHSRIGIGNVNGIRIADCVGANNGVM
jgi:hypothetical protein